MEPLISVRIVNADCYYSGPVSGLDTAYSSFRASEVKRVPVIRIFGSTLYGQKTCLHLHGIFPYLYIPYDGSMPSDQMRFVLAKELDKALNVILGTVRSNSQHVYEIVLVSGYPMYGYHKSEHQYFKVYFYNPLILKKAAELLSNGAVMNKVFQPHESHIPYVLQFLMDYNLQGMNFIHLKSFRFRSNFASPIGDYSFNNDGDSHPKIWTASNIPASMVLPSYIEAKSCCLLEIDAVAGDILNRYEIEEGVLMNPGLASIWEDEIQRRRQKGLVEPLGPPLSQDRLNVQSADSELFYLRQLKARLSDLAPTDLSVTVAGVNSQLDSTLAVETPDDASILPASHTLMATETDSLDKSARKRLELSQVPSSLASTISFNEEDQELAAILEALAANQEDETTLMDTSTTPTQRSAQDGPVIPHSDSEESDGERQTLEMTQTHWATEEGNEIEPEEDPSSISAVPSPQPNSDSLFSSNPDAHSDAVSIASCSSSDLNFNWPNLDGAFDSSSSDEEQGRKKVVKKENKEEAGAANWSLVKLTELKKTSPTKKRFTPLEVTFRPSRKRSKTKLELPEQVLPIIAASPDESSSDRDMLTRLGTQECSKLTISTSLTQPNLGNLPNTDPLVPNQLPAIEERRRKEVVGQESVQFTATSIDLEPQTANPTECRPVRVSLRPLIEEMVQFEGKTGRKLSYRLEPSIDHRNRTLSRFLSINLPPMSPKVSRYSHTYNRSQSSPAIVLNSPNCTTREAVLTQNSNLVEDTSDLNVISAEITSNRYLQYADLPPSTDRIIATLETYGLPSVLPIQAFWGDPNDEPKSASTRSSITSLRTEILPSFQTTFFGEGLEALRKRSSAFPWGLLSDSLAQDMEQFVVQSPVLPVVITPLLRPPSYERIQDSLKPKTCDTELIPTKQIPKNDQKSSPCPTKPPVDHSTPLPGISQRRRSSILGVSSTEMIAIPSIAKSPVSGSSGVSKRRRISFEKKNTVSSGSSTGRKSDRESTGSPLITAGLLRTPRQRRQTLFASSQLEGPSLNNTFGFKVTLQNFQDAKAVHDHQHLTVMNMELHVSTRENLRPDPEFDSIEAIFYSITNDVEMHSGTPRQYSGVILVDVEGLVSHKDLLRRSALHDLNVKCVENESTLLRAVIDLVKLWDPDILLGYEIEMHSWGYLLQRGTQLGLNLRAELGRLPETALLERDQQDEAGDHRNEALGYFVEKNSTLVLVGRIVLNLWRLLRPELALTSYTFENMAYHILHQRIPDFSYQALTEWWSPNLHKHRWRVAEHYMARVQGSVKIVEQLDLIGRTSELARLFGIQFYEVLTRGSQWRVESMMLRLAKPLNFIPVSPSVQQRAKMKAPEFLPLIMEPESKFYTDPVLVLDFQSLYPSMIIAYNYCFSTCLGRTSLLGKATPFAFGCTGLLVPPEVIAALQNQVNISPAGAVFVKSSVRRGILPRMLEEILDTRLMVKQSMKMYKEDKLLQRVLDARQLGLKLIANVTYGYTSANFSGRMPCVEIADSVVSKGRETLERAIKLVESSPQWGARVIYGDTDSMFVLVSGKSRAEAFTIGAEIAEAVTKTNPKPVKLKFEKVYQPCFLQTKKRYVGYSYESPDQKEPLYDAKGIETVRRDGCPAVVKILEKSLRILFETYNVSSVKNYVQRQFSKILQGRVSLQDFTFAKEYRGPQGYRPGACVPALEISKKLVQWDRKADFRVGQRVPYVIVYGSPGLPLIQLVKQPMEVLSNPSLRLNAHYYITRAIIPPLQRCLGLLGLDTYSWYSALPRMLKPASNWNPAQISTERESSTIKKPGLTISQYFVTLNCLLCDQQTRSSSLHAGLCEQCSRNVPQTAALLAYKARAWEKTYFDMIQVCGYCAGRAAPQALACISLDCPILYKRCLAQRDADKAPVLWHQLDKLYR